MNPIQLLAEAAVAIDQALQLGQLVKRLLADGGRDATAEEVAAARETRASAEERYRQS